MRRGKGRIRTVTELPFFGIAPKQKHFVPVACKSRLPLWTRKPKSPSWRGDKNGDPMARQERYQFAQKTRQLCAILKVDPSRVMRRAGLCPDLLNNEGRGLSADELLSVWDAVLSEAQNPEACFTVAVASAHAVFSPPIFAFSCSPTVEIGLRRLSLFKPLIGPCEMTLTPVADGLEIRVVSRVAGGDMPSSLQAFDLIYLVELIRTHTAEEVVPMQAGLPEYAGDLGRLEDYLRTSVTKTEALVLKLRSSDLALPLITENEEMWAMFEVDLQRKLLDRERDQRISARVKSALLELLPSGQATADAVSTRLNMSKRSLHRHLSNDGNTFQGVLDATRTELSLHYLRNDDITIEEISYLLAYSDPNSFYRAFRGWTGMTPMEARGVPAH